MSATKARRFWTEVRVTQGDEGHIIQLDGRPIKTPARQIMALPQARLAEAVAAEWDAQGEMIRPDSMPLTRMVNTALDQVPAKRAAIVEELTRYGASDLLCYRASTPQKLHAAQLEEWDPPLAWLRARHGIALRCTEGVMPVDQPEAWMKFPPILADQSDFSLVGLSEMAALAGSLVLALAAAEGWAAPEELFERSRLDERVQAEDWGEDDEAAARATHRKECFVSACSLVMLSR